MSSGISKKIKMESGGEKKRKIEEEAIPLLRKVISGGQTGADMAGLLAAQKAGLETGGTYAPGQKQETLLKSLGLTPLTGAAASFAAALCRRSMKNVDDSDATVAFRTHASPGTDKTIGYCVTRKWQTVSVVASDSGYRPVLVISDMSSPEAKATLIEFLKRHRVSTLNVAGHRASAADNPGGWQERVEAFLADVFTLFVSS